ncbi:MAG: carboxypeptidase-like regulatory domain-containing protein, partial [Calditrichaceae bacterium]
MKNIQSNKVSIITKIFLRFIFPTVLLFSFTMVYAQGSGRVAGLILDKVSGDPLPGANLMLEGTSLGASTDLNGEYLISKVPPGSYNLVVKYIGYKELSIPINVEPDERVYQLVELEYVAIEGETIVVTAQAEGQME